MEKKNDFELVVLLIRNAKQQLPSVKHWVQNLPDLSGSSFLACYQEDPSKLSDQQEAVKWAQNPYPIYAAVNVRPNMSSGDFAGMNMDIYFCLLKSITLFHLSNCLGSEQVMTGNTAQAAGGSTRGSRKLIDKVLSSSS